MNCNWWKTQFKLAKAKKGEFMVPITEKNVKLVSVTACYKELERMSSGPSIYIYMYTYCNIYGTYILKDLMHWNRYDNYIYGCMCVCSIFHTASLFIVTKWLHLFSTLWSLKVRSSGKKQVSLYQKTQTRFFLHFFISVW